MWMFILITQMRNRRLRDSKGLAQGAQAGSGRAGSAPSPEALPICPAEWPQGRPQHLHLYPHPSPVPAPYCTFSRTGDETGVGKAKPRSLISRVPVAQLPRKGVRPGHLQLEKEASVCSTREPSWKSSWRRWSFSQVLRLRRSSSVGEKWGGCLGLGGTPGVPAWLHR